MSSLFERYEDDGILTFDAMVRYGRLRRMDESLHGLTISLYAENTKEISTALQSAYTSGFNDTGEAISRAWGQQSLIGIIREEEMHRALTNEISGLEWAKRMDNNRDTTVARIRETIVRGLYEGETYSQMAQRLNTALGKDTVNAIRIVRTECYRVFSEARKDRLDRVRGVTMTKEWLTSEDERVRSNHSLMHGVKIPYDQDFILPNGNSGFGPGMIGSPSDDINCRCFWVIDIADDDGSGGSMDIPGFYEDDINGEEPEIMSVDDALNEMKRDAMLLPEHIRTHYEPILHRDNFVIDLDMQTPLAYNRNDGRIYLNPSHPNFDRYDLQTAFAHEIGHKLDIETLRSHDNGRFIAAIQTATFQVEDDMLRYIGLIEDSDKYNDSMSVGDIMSALSQGQIQGGYFHSPEYWEIPGKVEAEIFADMFTAEVTDDKLALSFIRREMPYLLSAFYNLFL